MYQPALRPEQVKALYYLKLKLGRPMTELVREAVETYLNEHGGCSRIIPVTDKCELCSKGASVKNRAGQVSD